MKKLVCALMAWFMVFLASCGGGGDQQPSSPPATPPDLSGEWVQTNSGADDTYHAAYISDDAIEVYWVMESDDTTALYWAGSFDAPTVADEPYEWESKNDKTKTEYALLASGDDNKTFTYKNGVITYTASAMGSTTTVELEKQVWGYDDLELALGGGGEVVEGAGDLGDYHVSIKGAMFGEDYDGKPAIIITYDWTNNSDETTSAMSSVIAQAFQDGVELEFALIANEEIYNSENSMKEVRPGTTIEVQDAFVMTSESSVVEFEISEFLGFSGSMVIMEFDPSAP